MSESYIVTLEILVFSVETKHSVLCLFSISIQRSRFGDASYPSIVKHTTEKAVCAKLFTISSSSTFENGDVGQAHT